MKFSIYFSVSIVVMLLFLTSAVSLLFALMDKNTSPLILTAAANIVAVVFLVFLITRGILIPLGQVRSIMKKVGEGNFGLKIAASRIKEMQEFGDTINEMIVKLRTSTQELQEAKSSLELRVAGRTKELQGLAASLEEKVKERTRELQEKLTELERFEKLAIGRELKMIELKEELKKLEELILKKKTDAVKPRRKNAA